MYKLLDMRIKINDLTHRDYIEVPYSGKFLRGNTFIVSIIKFICGKKNSLVYSLVLSIKLKVCGKNIHDHENHKDIIP